MKSKKIIHIEAAIDFIENHLNEKLGLETVAEAVHYSKYHLHRMFTETVGMTIHDYISRRQLTEAAKLLVFGEKSIMEIAFSCGYESQQAFTSVFKMMYKLPPAQYREHGQFYPLQLKFTLHRKAENIKFALEDIRLADMADIPAWMELVKMVIDGYPHLKEEEYLHKLKCSIEKRETLILMFGEIAVGIMAFSYESGSIEFMGVHLQYRSCGISRLFLDKLMKEYLPGRVISTTTYRENDKADTGYRNELKKLGFAERELLMEFGYPTQRFVLPIKE